MGMKNLPDISRRLIDAGMDPNTPAALVRWGTTPRHRSLTATLSALPQAAVEHGFSSPSLIVVGGVVSLHDKLNWFEQNPLLGKTVVVTRAREQAGESAALLQSLGAEVIQFPTIEIIPLKDYAPVDAAIRALGSYAWVVFTSVNGVRHFWARLAARGLDSRALGHCGVAAIGPATADALRAKGIEPDFIPEKFVAEGIVEGMIARCGKSLAGMRLLLPRAARARDVLPEALGKAGAVVDVLPVYETIPSSARRDEVLERLRAGEIDCITFGSSSTVENLLELIPAAQLKQFPTLRFACIGPITAKTLEDAGLVCHFQPKEYTIPAMVAELVDRL